MSNTTTSTRPSSIPGTTNRLPVGTTNTGTGGIRRPSPVAPYFPYSDTATFRDLLLFEERLKMNAEMLRRRRRRYNAFLWTFILTLAWLLHRWLFTPPQNHMSMRAVQASLAVVVITLFLFFASGMYEEKIRYAHAYINHSNKALRPLNMHLNMRRPPPSFPIPFIRSSTTPTQTSSTATTPGVTHKALSHRRQSATGSTSTVMATIPPSSNPRGELIFSSRVDKSFREGYERYRAAFERRREEKAREEARRNARWFRRRGNGVTSMSGTGTPTPPASRRGTPPPSLRGRTPSPGVGSRLRNSIDMGRTSSIEGSGEKDGQGIKEKRERAESYSFVWSREEGMPRRAP